MNFRAITTLQWALGASIAVHAVLLTVRFVDPEAFNRVFEDTPLEVILVNAKTNEKPDAKARAIAQFSMNGGGNANDGRATSPLPPSPTEDTGDTLEQTMSARKLQSMQEQQNLLLSQVKNMLATMPMADPREKKMTPEQIEREEKRRQLVKLLAEIERRVNMENARPKKGYLTPSTRGEDYAVYYDKMKHSIEDRGTENFPTSAGKKLYGELTMIVTVNHNGRIVDTEVVESSGNTTLDRRAAAIVKAAGPFDKFPPELRRQWDQLAVVSRFKFTRDETLEATVKSNP